MSQINISAPWSYSQLSTFINCPAQLLYYKDKSKIQEESQLLLIGNLCHQVLENYVQLLSSNKANQDLELFEIAYNNVDVPSYITDEVYMITSKWAKYFRLELHSYYGVEKKLAVDKDWGICEYWDEKAYLRGKIDRLHIIRSGDRIIAEIIDYKAGFSKNVDKLQFIIYALLVKCNMPFVKEIYVKADFIRQFSNIKDLITDKNIDQLKSALPDLINTIKSSDYKETLNPYCSYCGYQSYCSTYKEVMLRGKWQGLPILDIANTYLIQKENVSEMKKKLEIYCEKYGSIKFPNGKELYLDTQPTQAIQDIKAFKIAYENVKDKEKSLRELDYYCQESLSQGRLKAKVFKNNPEFSILFMDKAKTPSLKIR